MGDIAISVTHLTKCYSISQQGRYDTIRDRLTSAITRWGRTRQNSVAKNRVFSALTDVSFDVKQGEVFGIVGHNGAGKSTLLKILSRITAPTSGCADIYGRLGSLLEVGTGFHLELTGRRWWNYCRARNAEWHWVKTVVVSPCGSFLWRNKPNAITNSIQRS